MAKAKLYLGWTVVAVIWLCVDAKLSENEYNATSNVEVKPLHKVQSGSGILFADELKLTLEKYLFGICPQSFKMSLLNKNRTNTVNTCDPDTDHNDLAGKLATLALRARSASRGECSNLGTALSNIFSDLARTASNRETFNSATNDANKKRKLSKSQKAKIQAKQRTALAVKKKAAALAAAAAAKMAST